MQLCRKTFTGKTTEVLLIIYVIGKVKTNIHILRSKLWQIWNHPSIFYYCLQSSCWLQEIPVGDIRGVEVRCGAYQPMSSTMTSLSPMSVILLHVDRWKWQFQWLDKHRMKWRRMSMQSLTSILHILRSCKARWTKAMMPFETMPTVRYHILEIWIFD